MGLSIYRKYGKAGASLSLAAKENRLSHAYIIEGDHNIDKEGFAKALCQALLCRQAPGEGCGRCAECRKIADENHEDLHFVRPEDTTKGKTGTSTIKDAQIEQLQAELKQKPTACEHNMAVISGADTMTARAQTRFLKTLEEPTEGTLIMMLSENSEELLPTINSRCVKVRLYDLSGRDDNEMLGLAAAVLKMMEEKAFFFDIRSKLDEKIDTRDSSYAFLDALEVSLSDIVKKRNENARIDGDKAREAISLIEGARNDIKLGASYAYQVRNLILKMEDIF